MAELHWIQKQKNETKTKPRHESRMMILKLDLGSRLD